MSEAEEYLKKKVLFSDLLFRSKLGTKPKFDSWKENKRREVVLFSNALKAVRKAREEVKKE